MPTGIPKTFFIKECDICHKELKTLSNNQKHHHECNPIYAKKYCECCGVVELKNKKKHYCDVCNNDKNTNYYCSCGCGKQFTAREYIIDGRRFIHGHYNKNRPLSYEHKKSISDSNRQHPGVYVEKPKRIAFKFGSQEHRQRMSEVAKKNGFGKWMTGKKLSDHTKKILSIKSKGHIVTDEMKDKISKANLGKNNGMFGKNHTNEAKEKIKKTSIERANDPIFIAKMQEYRKTQECSDNARLGALAAYEKIKNNGFCDTKPELQMQDILLKNDVSFEKQVRINNIKHAYFCDFFIKDYNLIIEVDGRYWHNYPHGREKDHIREKELIDKGYKILRFWEDHFNENLVQDRINNIIHI